MLGSQGMTTCTGTVHGLLTLPGTARLGRLQQLAGRHCTALTVQLPNGQTPDCQTIFSQFRIDNFRQ